MHSPTASTYTTIPISGTDVISRSFQNLSTFLSRRRPWPEFLSFSGHFHFPSSLSSAALRLKLNSKYFSVNYSILISLAAAFSLIASPISLLVYSSISLLWLVLYFFREDPMVVLGRGISDRVVTVGLVVISAVAVCFTGFVNNLLIGIGVGVFIVSVHGVLRSTDGLFLDENDAVSNGLIGSRPLI